MAQERPGNKEVPRSGVSEDTPLVTYETETTPIPTGNRRRWWRMPMLAMGGAVVIAAVWVIMAEISTPTMGERIQAAQNARDRGDLPSMQDSLEALAAGSLEDASVHELARYHALSGDWIWLRQQWHGIDEQSNHARISAHYKRAEDLGLHLDTVRQERWARAAIRTGHLEVATMLLDRMNGAEPGTLDAERRHRLHRTWLEALVLQDSADPEHVQQELVTYRDDEATELDDMAWSMEQLANMYLATGRLEQASQLLHADLRRLESRSRDSEQSAPLERLLVLLARCERDLGRYDEAEIILAQALELCAPYSTARGDALVLQGELLAADGLLEAALERFELALDDTPAAASNLPALLHRGELRSMLGDQVGALTDFSAVIRSLDAGRSHPDVDRPTIVGVLMDRSESSLVQGRLSESLAFAQLAWDMHADDDPPGPVATAVALAAGQLAKNAGQAWQETVEQTGAHRSEESLTLRERTISLHLRAAEASRAAARWWHDLPEEGERWRAALADVGWHEDAAGRTSEAIVAYQDAIDASIETDPGRVEFMHALAQCLQVECRFDEAAGWYERILLERPGSPAATRSHVPLARCYEALDRVDDAWRQLQQIVEGHGVLTPEATDHRRALLELGALGFRTGRYEAALSWLDVLLVRATSPSDMLEARLLVSGCSRGAARLIEAELLDGTPRSAGRCVELEARRQAFLLRALEACMVVTTTTKNPTTPSETLARRRALVDLGDTSWDLGRWEDAIRAYEQVARDYASHPISMHALVQIASAWVELGDRERAEAAHERALRRLESMPDANLAALDSLMDREVWDRWMRVMPVGAGFATGVER